MLHRRSLMRMAAALPVTALASSLPTLGRAAPVRPRLHFGWIPDTYRAHRSLYRAPICKGPEHLPPKVDLRPEMPPVYDQGDIGSCVANALAAAIQYVRHRNGQLPDFVPSRLFIYYNGRDIEGHVDSDNGLQLQDAIDAVKRFGACDEHDWPYDPTPADPHTNLFPSTSRAVLKPDKKIYDEAYPHRAIDAFSIGRELDDMRACLTEGYPFAFGFWVYSSFYDPDTGRPRVTVPIPSEDDQYEKKGHAVLAVGYDDSRGVFICRNSWNVQYPEGGEVQDQGHFYMPYGYVTDPKLSSDLWTIRMVYSLR